MLQQLACQFPKFAEFAKLPWSDLPCYGKNGRDSPSRISGRPPYRVSAMVFHSDHYFHLQHLECLEDRTTPNVHFVNGVLTIFGSGGPDRIEVQQVGNNLTVGGQSFDATAVRQIVIDAGDGDDTISISPAVSVEVWAFGRGGNDRIQGGGPRSHLFGGPGDDTLIAGSSADLLVGGPGVNSVLGHGASVTSGSLSQSAALDVVGRTIVDLINRERAGAGLPVLETNAQLVAAGQIHSRNMASLVTIYGHPGAMSHVLLGSTTPTLGTRADLVGYDYRLLAENLAFGYLTPQAVVEAWMNSPGHRANILNWNFTQVGVGVAWSTDGIPYYTLVLGTPMPARQPSIQQPSIQPPANTDVSPPRRTATPAPAVPVSETTAVTLVPTNSARRQTSTNSDPSVKGWVAVAAGPGSAPWVRIVDATTGQVRRQFLAYDRNFRGGVRLAVADVTGDGIADIITAPGPGMSPWIKVFDSASGRQIHTFLAYDPRWTGGVNVAAGDVTGNGVIDILTASDAPSAGLVRVFEGRSFAAVRTFYAFPGTKTGSQLWVADFNGDGRNDIVTAPSSAGGYREVRVFDGRNSSLTSLVVGSGGSLAGLAVGDVDGDGRSEFIVTEQSGTLLRVMSHDGTVRQRIDLGAVASAVVTARDLNGDGKAEIVTTVTTNRGGRRLLVFTTTGQLWVDLAAPIEAAAIA
jgi:uncharacterized protein YkwD